MNDNVISLPLTNTAKAAAKPEPILTLAQASQAYQQAEAEEHPVITLPWQARLTLITLFIAFVTIGAMYFWITPQNDPYYWLPPLMTALWIASGTGALALLYWIWREFSCFGDELSEWSRRLRKGDLTARMPVHGAGCPSRMIREQINAITEDYQALSRMQRQRLTRQQKRIEQTNRHLSVLYDVATCINRAESLDNLLNRFLYTLKDVVNAEAAAVRLLDKDNRMRLVASIGLDKAVVKLEEYLPMTACLCGQAVNDCSIKVSSDVAQCGQIIGRPMFGTTPNIEMLAIPLQYRDQILGIYNLFVPRDEQNRLENEHELLLSIGQHLGMAIAKANLDEEARTLSVIEERTRMAHELHDSLAQTLASLRFKVRLFDDSLQRGDEAVIWQELESLENTIDEAYAELRSLIIDFRAPLDGKGVVRAVERLVERFRQETGMDVFFYHNWNLKDLPRETEIEAIRIVQESLTNVRKHSQAATVRILMHSTEEGHCSILVEDDGVGLPDPLPQPDPATGEHIGMRIMQERAERIDGEIQFESEPGEGTLMQLNFDAPPDKRLSDLVGSKHIIIEPRIHKAEAHERKDTAH